MRTVAFGLGRTDKLETLRPTKPGCGPRRKSRSNVPLPNVESCCASVRRRRAAALVVAAEALPLVAGDDHERAVVEAGPAELAQDQAERAVGVAQLEQVALLAL